MFEWRNWMAHLTTDQEDAGSNPASNATQSLTPSLTAPAGGGPG